MACKKQTSALDTKLRELDQEFHALENQQIDKTELRTAFQDFGAVHANAAQDVRRKLLKVIIEEIHCTVRTRAEHRRVRQSVQIQPGLPQLSSMGTGPTLWCQRGMGSDSDEEGGQKVRRRRAILISESSYR